MRFEEWWREAEKLNPNHAQKVNALRLGIQRYLDEKNLAYDKTGKIIVGQFGATKLRLVFPKPEQGKVFLLFRDPQKRELGIVWNVRNPTQLQRLEEARRKIGVNVPQLPEGTLGLFSTRESFITRISSILASRHYPDRRKEQKQFGGVDRRVRPRRSNELVEVAKQKGVLFPAMQRASETGRDLRLTIIDRLNAEKIRGVQRQKRTR